MKNKSKSLALILSSLFVLTSLTACSDAKTTSTESTTVAEANATAETASATDSKVLNFIQPEIGEEIAVINVKDYGTIKIKLFEDASPKGVENFKGLIDLNYYDELIFHRIIPNFMNQGGDPRGDGTGGKSMWGGQFDGGIAEGLYHFTGAVAYANSGSTSTDGSQFYIVNTPEGYLQNTCEELMNYDPDTYSWPQEVIDLYNEKGGTPFLDGSYTVFGQVFEGMDVVYAISQVETDANDKPLTQVQMETVRIEEYQG